MMMFSSTQSDGAAAFMPSQSQFDPNTTTQSPAKSRDSHGIIPVTVKQISQASHSGDEKSNFTTNGADLVNVSLVGIVSNKSERVTDIAFTLDDGTGLIDCNKWINEPSDSWQMKDIEDGMYVRANGRLRSFQGKTQLVAFSARPVTNFDEISYHFIECIHFHVQNNKVQKGQGDAYTQPQMVNPSLNSPLLNGTNGHQTGLSFHNPEQLSVDGLKGFDQMVLDYLQQPINYRREKGIHRDELVQKLKVPVDKIMESIRTLEEEGLIYSTIDEFHYKSTTSC